MPFLTLAPDWLCEVVSPRTARHDRVHKLRSYGRGGVGHVWLVDPLARVVEIYRREGDTWVVASTHAGSEPLRAEPFAALELSPGSWWLTTTT